jgi:hypothetical protein
VSVLLPDRKYRGLWHRVLHDRTADSLLSEISKLPHANVTSVPFQLDSGHELDTVSDRALIRSVVGAERARAAAPETSGSPRGDGGGVPISEARWRDHVTISGSVRSIRVVSSHDSPTLEIVVADDDGAISIVFLGRRQVAGIRVDSMIEATGTVGVFQNRLAMLNPEYTLRS